MNSPDILICLPTRNEEENIIHVTKTVDEGLSKYFPDKKALLLNVDSDSTDATRQTFLSHETAAAKLSISGTLEPPGKGSNILTFLEYAAKKNVPYLAMFDTDLRSIEASWVKKMLGPVISDRADFVSPLYTRNPYEGNTTNHICVPLLKFMYGSSYRQPIAGDFAFSGAYADKIMELEKIQSIKQYGIDIFLTYNSLNLGLRNQQVFLGRKIHNPSFGSMVPMVFEVVKTLIWCTLTTYTKPEEPIRIETVGKTLGIDEVKNKPSTKDISDRRNYAIKEFRELAHSSYLNHLLPDNIISSLPETGYAMPKHSWEIVLSNLTRMITSRKIAPEIKSEIDALSNAVRVLYLFRVLTYFQEIEEKSPIQIESILEYNYIREKTL